MAVSIVRAETPEDLDAVRALIREFPGWAISRLSPTTDPPKVCAGLDDELAGLPGRFGPPTGYLLLARLDGASAGCSRSVLCSHHKLHAARSLFHRAGFGCVPCSRVPASAEPDVEVCMEMIPARDAR